MDESKIKDPELMNEIKVDALKDLDEYIHEILKMLVKSKTQKEKKHLKGKLKYYEKRRSILLKQLKNI